MGIRLGVDRIAEATMVQQAFERAGYVLIERRQGHNYVALQFGGDAGPGKAVRVVTDRGISLALDGRAASPLHGQMMFELSRVGGEGELPAVGVGTERIFITQRSGPDGGTCVRAFDVLSTGRIEAVVEEKQPDVAQCEEGW